MDREIALKELKTRLSNENLIKHSLAVEAIMRGMAVHFKEDEEQWALAGLLHDIDYEETIDSPDKHGIVGGQILEDMEIEKAIVFAVKAHNSKTGFERKRRMDKTLYAADPLAGLIVASALILPSKKLEDVNVDFVIKRMSERSFAKGANREQIKSCIEIELSVEKFIGIALQEMKAISNELGL